jgi:uncharacterized tellurite resistance protein B-like protein
MHTYTLDRDDRMRLMKFVCAFAWADLDIADQERSFVHRISLLLDLDAEDRAQVAEWMELPPSAEELDPAEVPPAHRRLFLELARDLIHADGDVSEVERENLHLLEQLFGRAGT